MNNQIEIGDLVCNINDSCGKRGIVESQEESGFRRFSIAFDDTPLRFYYNERNLLLVEKRPKELVI